MPPVDNPELALILGGVPDTLEESGGDLYSVIVNVAVLAVDGRAHPRRGRLHRLPGQAARRHRLAARMDTITTMQPDITKWCNREVWTSPLNDTGYDVTRR